MPLSERTGRALEACYDAILEPARWSSALQLLGESLGGVSCLFFEHDRDPSLGRPMSVEHEGFSDLWARNEPHAPDPHVGQPWLERCKFFLRSGCGVAIEHQFST